MELKKLNIGRDPYSCMTKSSKASMNFSEGIYEKLGISLLEKEFGYTNIIPSSDVSKYISSITDGKMALDHYVKDANNDFATIQSRFRKASNSKWSDFTIRYDLPSKSCECEFYHLEADFVFYGAVDADDVASSTKITKYLLINARKLKKLFESKKVVPDEKIKCPYVDKNGVLHCVVRSNIDSDYTRLIAIDPKLLSQIDNTIIIKGDGYAHSCVTYDSYLLKDLGINAKTTNKENIIFNTLGEKLLNSFFDWEVVNFTDEFDKYLFSETSSKMNVNAYLKDPVNNIAGVFVRLRDSKYSTYNDFTIRYDWKDGRYDPNIEYKNLNGDLMFYGFCDEDPKEFSKWILINLKELRKSMNEGQIIPQMIYNFKIESNILYVPICENKYSNDSRFLSLDAKAINQINDNIIIAQRGYNL